MKFGIRYCNIGPYANPVGAVELAQAAEAAGFESMWTTEHIVFPADHSSAYPYTSDGKIGANLGSFDWPDPLIWLAYVAAATSRIRLATGILILPQHNPLQLAKQVASLDHLSGGRVLLGVGVGWLREEAEAMGTSFDDRGQRADEYIQVIRELWSKPEPSFHGDFVRFPPSYMEPKPVHGTVPIIVAGEVNAAVRRAARLGDGFFPSRGLSVRQLELLRSSAEEYGRDPAEIEITVSMPTDLDLLPELAAQGVGRVLIPVNPAAGSSAPVSGIDDLPGWTHVIERYKDL
ncbi:LLM class F420-dependent oxidoreductase [Nocardia sp. NPDC059246]|uniref:LLM class F420-dependent oxidoreductase n=1 Tax=unclassified Nocardia TaxID=2637762 RepID=UPI003691DD4A